MRTKQRDLLRESAFPWHGTMEEKIAYLLRYAILAPSSHDSRPWRFSVVQNMVELRPDFRRWRREADPDSRELYISLGCTLENLLIAAERFGFGHEVAYPAEGHTSAPAASVTLLAEGTPSTCRPSELFETITARAMNGDHYEACAVPADAAAQLRECAVDGGVGVFLTDDPEIRRRVLELVVRSDRQLFSNASWRCDAAALAGTPLVGLLHSNRDDRESRIRAGQAFERLTLMAARRGLSSQPLSAIVQLADIRRSLPVLLPDPDACPQQLFRVGYARVTPRPAQRPPLRAVSA